MDIQIQRFIPQGCFGKQPSLILTQVDIGIQMEIDRHAASGIDLTISRFHRNPVRQREEIPEFKGSHGSSIVIQINGNDRFLTYIGNLFQSRNVPVQWIPINGKLPGYRIQRHAGYIPETVTCHILKKLNLSAEQMVFNLAIGNRSCRCDH